MRRKVFAFVVFAAVVAASVLQACGGQAPRDPAIGPPSPQTPPSPTSSPGGPADAAAEGGPADAREVEAFLDGFFAQQLRAYGIPGATVTVVRDGEVVVAKGYGEADVAEGEPVRADETLFRIASISKLFTATAVMQLAERGDVGLDEDVNAYMDDVHVPDTYPGRPVTLQHLLTHTAGFEERGFGSGARDAADVEPLGDYLAEQTPARVRPPGEVASYSNYGMSLAGHVVEEVSGVPFERYVEENVLAPIGMEHTTAAQPPAPGLEEHLATGYDLEGGRPVARPFEYIDDAPAGTVSTTAADMTRFMISHLQNGRYGGARILEGATAEEMHERQFGHHPRLNGMAYGFYEQGLNGERVIAHSGNLSQFHSQLALLPERGVGIFVAYNSYGDGGNLAEYELLEAFLDRYYPEPGEVRGPGEEPATERPKGAERFAGSYRVTRSNRTGFEKALTLFTGVEVAANDDGSITTFGLPSQDFEKPEQRWVRVGPLLFRSEDRNEYVAFREGWDGGVEYLFGDADATVAYEKLPAHLAPGPHRALLGGSLAIFLATALLWPAGAVISARYRRRYGKREEGRPETGAARRARVLAWAVCALGLAFVGGVVLAFSAGAEALTYGASPALIFVLTLPLVGAVGTVGVTVCAVLAWRRRWWGAFGRLHYSLVAFAALTFVALLGYYNLLGFRF